MPCQHNAKSIPRIVHVLHLCQGDALDLAAVLAACPAQERSPDGEWRRPPALCCVGMKAKICEMALRDTFALSQLRDSHGV